MKKKIALLLTAVLMLSVLSGCAGTTVVYDGCTCPTGVPEAGTTIAPVESVVSEGAVKTGLYVGTTIADSTSADAENEGQAKFDITLVAVTVNDAGVIESCVIDSVPATVNFGAAGVITSDITAAVSTKNELGESYGMKAYGGAIAEWNEQAAAFAAYVTGKTAEEVAGIAVNEKTAPADGTDLASSVTISIGGFQALIAKAAAQ